MIAQPADPAPVALLAAHAFESLEIPYLVGGSVASTVHGEPRGTLDVDFAVHMDADQAAPLARALRSDFFVDEESIREAAETKRMFNAIHKTALLKVDVHVRAAEGHSAAEMQRAQPIDLGSGAFVRVATPEDTLLRKLWWYRLGDEVSDRQWRDVLGVLRSLGDEADRDYLSHWASDLEIMDLLLRAMDECAE